MGTFKSLDINTIHILKCAWFKKCTLPNIGRFVYVLLHSTVNSWIYLKNDKERKENNTNSSILKTKSTSFLLSFKP